jgi:pimeloyl-ACP methyl ester carboxylesterase
VLPAELAYGALITALGSDADAVAKDLEVYATAQPPDDYSLDLEVDGLLREADARRWERLHLVGYSGGGAAALAFTARHSDRLFSLALLEPGLGLHLGSEPSRTGRLG